MPKSGSGSRLEPKGPEFLEAHPKALALFERAEWYPYCTRLNGSHYQVARSFLEQFNESKVRLPGLKFELSESFISEACRLPVNGERWFKGKVITGGDINYFLKRGHQDPNWAQGLPVRYLKRKWREPVRMIQAYITCEGRFSLVFLYHMRLLFHLAGFKQINLSYFFLRSLMKLSNKVKSNSKLPEHCIYHQGLIKILVTTALEQKGKNWSHFLIRSGFSKNVEDTQEIPATQEIHEEQINLNDSFEIDPDDVETLADVLNKMKSVQVPGRTPMKITPLATKFQGESSSKGKEKVVITDMTEGKRHSKRQKGFIEAIHAVSNTEGLLLDVEGPDIGKIVEKVKEYIESEVQIEDSEHFDAGEGSKKHKKKNSKKRQAREVESQEIPVIRESAKEVQQEKPVEEQSHSGKKKSVQHAKPEIEPVKQVISPGSIPLVETPSKPEASAKYRKKKHEKSIVVESGFEYVLFEPEDAMLDKHVEKELVQESELQENPVAEIKRKEERIKSVTESVKPVKPVVSPMSSVAMTSMPKKKKQVKKRKA